MNTTQPSTIIGIVLVALILLGMAGTALSNAAKDYADRVNQRHAETISQLYGN